MEKLGALLEPTFSLAQRRQCANTGGQPKATGNMGGRNRVGFVSPSLVVVVIGVEKGDEGGRGLFRYRIRVRGNIDLLSEGVGSVVEHALGERMRLGDGLNSEVAEHGVRFPSPHELDSVTSDASAEKCGGTAWAEATGTEEVRVNARGWLKMFGGMADAVGDEGRPDGRRGVVGIHGVQGSIRRCVVLSEVKDNAA